MLYYLFNYLDQLDFPGAGMFKYVSFRSGLALILSLFISTAIGRRIIDKLRVLQIGETVRDLGLEGQLSKKGTPTMGGIIIIIAILIPVLLCAKLTNIYVILMVVTTVWLGALGFADDYIKMKVSKDGLRPIYKLAGQTLLGLFVGLTLWLSPDAVIRENVTTKQLGMSEVVVHKSEAVKSTKTTIPFVKDNNLDYAELMSFCGKYKTAAGWFLFVVMTTLVVVAVSNGSNLNDGMDGMTAGNSAIIGVALGVLAYVSSHIAFASYLNIMYIPESEELVIFICAFVGALVGFLWYNAYPAQIFMGDTGSLSIGGIIAVTAIIIHKELLIPLMCFVFLMESLSVILQVNYAKWGNRKGLKLRVFKRAPIHDAFRVRPGQLAPDVKVLCKWPKGCWLESKITVRFWIITIILAAMTIITLKIR